MNPIQRLAIADQPTTCSEPAHRQDRRSKHRHTIRRVQKVLGQLDHGFRRVDRERVDGQRVFQTSNAHREDHIRNGRGASNSQGCCEPASSAMSPKKSPSPTFCITPEQTRHFISQDHRSQNYLLQSQFTHRRRSLLMVCTTGAQGTQQNCLRLVEPTQVKCRFAIRRSGLGSCVCDWCRTILSQEKVSR